MGVWEPVPAQAGRLCPPEVNLVNTATSRSTGSYQSCQIDKVDMVDKIDGRTHRSAPTIDRVDRRPPLRHPLMKASPPDDIESPLSRGD